MSSSETISVHLPYLRRFARALSGSQKSGDRYVTMVLEAILADPSLFSQELPPKIALYRIFLKLWNSVSVSTFPEFDANESETVHGLQTLTPRPRQAFILLTVEGFKPDQIAEILETSVTEVDQLIDEADREIAEQLPPSRIMIIEDEPLTAELLKELVESLGHGVTGIAATHKDAVALAMKDPPDLILSDIRLEDGSSGVEAVNEILGEIDAPVVYITGHPEELLTGEKAEPAFLISKPFHTKTVKAVLSQALFFRTRLSEGEEKQPEDGMEALHAGMGARK